MNAYRAVSTARDLASARKPQQANFEIIRPGNSQVDAFSRLGVHQSFKRRQRVFYEGDEATQHFRVTHGVVRVDKILFDGRRQVLGLVFPGDYFGFSMTGEYLYTAEAVTPCNIVRYKRSQFRSLIAQEPELIDRLAAMAADEIRIARERSLILGSSSPLERAATFLIMLQDRQEAGEPSNTIKVFLSRQEIGDYLGICMETVSRCFSRMKAYGLIALPDPHRIEILRQDALEDMANPAFVEDI